MIKWQNDICSYFVLWLTFLWEKKYTLSNNQWSVNQDQQHGSAGNNRFLLAEKQKTLGLKKKKKLKKLIEIEPGICRNRINGCFELPSGKICGFQILNLKLRM